MLALFLFGSTLAEAADAQAIREGLARFNAHARFPLPTLDDRDVARLVAGKVVKIREVPDEGPQRAVGLLLTHLPKEHLFLGASDPHATAVDELTEVNVGTHQGYPFRWYQHLDLPRPFADRHWVVDVRDNVDMDIATGGRCWEHYWTLADQGPTLATQVVAAGRIPGITPAMAEASVYVDVNDGAWLYIEVGEGQTLLGFNARSVIGGRVPDRLVADYTMLTLGRVMHGVVERVPEMLAHYDTDHIPVNGGDGKPLPRRSASDEG